MKIRTLCVLTVFLLFCGCNNREKHPQAIMVDHILYYSTGQVVPEVAPEDIFGHVESFTEGIPTENGQANFNQELGNPYAMTEASWLVVKVEDNWIRFQKKEVFWSGELDIFTFKKDLGYYAGLTLDELEKGVPPKESWVQTDGFVNTTPSSVQNGEDAVKLAKKECTMDYGEIRVLYDEATDMWLVVFSQYDPFNAVVGGCLSVYLDGNGITQLIVPGE